MGVGRARLRRAKRGLACAALALAACATGKGQPRAGAQTTGKKHDNCPERTHRAPYADRFNANPPDFRTLRLIEFSDPHTPLDPGNYRFELIGECYAASARFTLPFSSGGYPITVEGDDLDFVVHTNVVGIVVPARLRSVRVRIARNGRAVLDQLVTAATECRPTELPEQPGDEEPRFAPGLCVQHELDPPSGLCRDDDLYLAFRFGDDDSRWESGRAYQLELVQDGASTSCAFEVPLPMPAPKAEEAGPKPRVAAFHGLSQEPCGPTVPSSCPTFANPKASS